MKWLRKLIGTEDIYNQINDLNHYITGLRGEIGAIRAMQPEVHYKRLAQEVALLHSKLDTIKTLQVLNAGHCDPKFKADYIEVMNQLKSSLTATAVLESLDGQ